MIAAAARLQAHQRAFNLAVTNVPGPQEPRRLLGRELRADLPGAAAGARPGALDRGDQLRGPALLRPARRPRRARRPRAARRRCSRARWPSWRQGRGEQRAAAPARVDNRRMDPLRLALCQLNPTVGDIAANEAAIAAALDGARASGRRARALRRARGHRLPARGPALQGAFPARRARRGRAPRGADATGIVAVVGFPERAADVHNAAAVLADGRARRRSTASSTCPTTASSTSSATSAPGTRRRPDRARRARASGSRSARTSGSRARPCSDEALAGATLIVNLSASPYHAGKGLEREPMVIQRARENVAAFAFCAIVGGQDELVFDGHSFVVDHTGALLARAAQFEEELLVCDVDLDAPRRRAPAQLRPCARSRAAARRASSVLATLPAAAAPARRRRRRADRAAARAAGGRDLRGAASRPARLRRQERLRPRRARPLRRHRLGAGRDDRGRRARRRARQRRRDALAVLLGRDAGRRARARARRSASQRDRAADRRRHGRLRARCSRPSSPAARPTSPRRTCRRGSAATC